ncbi:MAG: hypothetical protein JWR77_1542 [Rhizorhabdus sp.]|nr:hypothetical protein [Rhizorhabdus sp.]
MKKLSAAVAAAVLLTTPALADTAPGREQVSIKVPTNGLDMSQADATNRLRARVNKAISEVCKPGGSYEAYQTIDPVCVDEMAAKADAIVQQIAAKASVSHLASN